MQTCRSGTQQRGGDGVVAWRQRQLIAAGFPRALADGLAGERRVDLHALLGLVEQGCPPALAARILAPADEEGDRR